MNKSKEMGIFEVMQALVCTQGVSLADPEGTLWAGPSNPNMWEFLKQKNSRCRQIGGAFLLGPPTQSIPESMYSCIVFES